MRCYDLAVSPQKQDFESKIEWANKHINDLHSALDEFIAINPYAVSVKRNPDTGEHIYYAAKVTPVPPKILLVAGDIFQNIRSSLDYLANALVRAEGGTPDKFTGYPIFETVPTTKEQKTAFARKVKGMRQEAVDIIEQTKPYKGGNAHLWRLHDLNIRDKHRLLLTAGAAVWQFNVGQHLRATDRATGLLTNATDWWIGRTQALLVEEGQHLLTDPPDAKVNKDIQFTFQVALNELGVCEGEPLIIVVRQSLNMVRRLIRAFEFYI